MNGIEISKSLSIHAIVACDEDNGIGYGGKLLFHIKDDLIHFQSKTIGHPIIIGRKTLSTFPNGLPLAGRTNIILSRDPDFKLTDAFVFNTIDDVLYFIKNRFSNEDIFVCGGDSIYKQFLPYCNVIDMTRIYSKKHSDSFFPEFGKEWKKTSESDLRYSDKYNCNYRFITYER